MNIKEKLKEIVSYYNSTRGVGHTTAAIRGVQNVDNALLMTATMDHAKIVERAHPSIKGISMGHPHGLRGRSNPMVIDHFALECLLSEAIEQIEKLEKELAESNA